MRRARVEFRVGTSIPGGLGDQQGACPEPNGELGLTLSTKLPLERRHVFILGSF